MNVTSTMAASAITHPERITVVSSALTASKTQDDLSSFFDSIGPVLFYAVVFGLVFAGTALFLGVFIPFLTGDTLLVTAGLVTAVHPNLSIAILVPLVATAAFLGDQIGYLIGKHVGRSTIDRGGRRLQTAIRTAERYYEAYGWWSVVIARFVPVGRVFIPVIAGVGRMHYVRFITSNLFGALAWGAGLTLVGYFTASIPVVKNFAYVLAAIVFTLSVIAGVRTWLRDRADRRRQTTDDT